MSEAMTPEEITAIAAATKEITGVIKGLFNWRAGKMAQKRIGTKTARAYRSCSPRAKRGNTLPMSEGTSLNREHKLSV
jgi:hypothetical protein